MRVPAHLAFLVLPLTQRELPAFARPPPSSPEPPALLPPQLMEMWGRKQDAEKVAAELPTDLTQAEEKVKALEGEVADHANHRLTIDLVRNNLGVPQPQETTTLSARSMSIMGRVGELEGEAFYTGVHRSFTVAHSHYGESIALDMISQGYAPGTEANDVPVLEADIASFAQNLANLMAGTDLPERVIGQINVFSCVG